MIENGDAVRRLVFHGRHSDLIIMGCPTQSDGLPEDRLERILLQSGCPLLVIPSNRPLQSLSTVLVCWKETAEAARAVSAALPLLMAARMVKVVSVAENSLPAEDGLRELVAYLGWHGLAVESEVLARGNRPMQDVLLSAARDLRADFMVMGGYGHAHAREVFFGGCTQAMLQTAELPVLFMH
jgi:nucleotide-binding universal stress UspA family protein